MLQLEVLVCTLNSGIKNIAQHLLPPSPGVSYLISWQQTPKTCPHLLPKELERPDVRVVTLEGHGLSKNRNHALQHAQGDILLISDDDVLYKEEHFQSIFQAFEQYPEANILTFQIENQTGKPLKKYVPFTFLYEERPKSTYFSSLEIAIRRNFQIPKFNEKFGLGTDYLACGEEEVFLQKAYNEGAVIRYIPKVIGRTEEGTTGKRFTTDAKVRHAKGAVLYYLHGYLGAILRCAKFALQLPDHRFDFFKDMFHGIQYARKINF